MEFRERKDRECHLLAVLRWPQALPSLERLESPRVVREGPSGRETARHPRPGLLPPDHVTCLKEAPPTPFLSLSHPILSSSLHLSTSEVTCLVFCFLGDYLSLPPESKLMRARPCLSCTLWLPSGEGAQVRSWFLRNGAAPNCGCWS